MIYLGSENLQLKLILKNCYNRIAFTKKNKWNKKYDIEYEIDNHD